jgi:hypothetical protein
MQPDHGEEEPVHHLWSAEGPAWSCGLLLCPAPTPRLRVSWDQVSYFLLLSDQAKHKCILPCQFKSGTFYEEGRNKKKESEHTFFSDCVRSNTVYPPNTFSLPEQKRQIPHVHTK